MVNPKKLDEYLATIGIECHVQLKTETKLFSSVGNDAREAPPNTLISHICLGMPGALPVLNEKAIELATKAAFALGTEPQHFSKFDRKHYFYPDLPKGYQITQFDQPIIIGGHVDIVVDGLQKRINLTRAHLEEDAGKSTHPKGSDFSLVDLNRAGTPLLEIVSEPNMHSAAEAKAYAKELYLLMKFADVSYANLYYGNMRFDVNVSVSKDRFQLGIRSETKNLNSFRSVEKAVDYEISRQVETLEKGGSVVQETRGWDDAKQRTFSQRSKENAHDYRYFPDPDLPPVILNEEFINKVKKSMPILPGDWRQRLSQLGLVSSHVETLIEAQADMEEQGYLTLLEHVLDDKIYAKQLANWVVNIDIPYIRDGNKKVTIDRTVLYRSVYGLVVSEKISSTKAKELIQLLLGSKLLPTNIEEYAQSKGFIQVSDLDEIDKIITQVLGDNPKAAEDVRNGELKAIGFLVGQVMKLSQGKMNPQVVQQLIKKQLIS